MNKTKKQISPMLCPVCGEFYFSRLTKEEIDDGETPNSVQCRHCGWFYDLEQTNDPNLPRQSNELCLVEYKREFEKKLVLNPKYDYFDEHAPAPTPHKCPVCGEFEFSDVFSFEVCLICGWQDDDFEEGGGANDVSADEAKRIFDEERRKNPSFTWASAHGIKIKRKTTKKKDV